MYHILTQFKICYYFSFIFFVDAQILRAVLFDFQVFYSEVLGYVFVMISHLIPLWSENKLFLNFLSLKIIDTWGWLDNSGVKSTGYSPKEPGSMSSTWHLTVLWNSCFRGSNAFFCSAGSCMNTEYINVHKHAHINKIHKNIHKLKEKIVCGPESTTDHTIYTQGEYLLFCRVEDFLKC